MTSRSTDFVLFFGAKVVFVCFVVVVVVPLPVAVVLLFLSGKGGKRGVVNQLHIFSEGL